MTESPIFQTDQIPPGSVLSDTINFYMMARQGNTIVRHPDSQIDRSNCWNLKSVKTEKGETVQIYIDRVWLEEHQQKMRQAINGIAPTTGVTEKSQEYFSFRALEALQNYFN